MRRRGDLLTGCLQADYGKPRPALVLQSDLLGELDSVVLCPISSELRTAAFRLTVEPTAGNGLQALPQVMVVKLATLPRAQIERAFRKAGRGADEGRGQRLGHRADLRPSGP